jgi:hypothetical protein
MRDRKEQQTTQSSAYSNPAEFTRAVIGLGAFSGGSLLDQMLTAERAFGS